MVEHVQEVHPRHRGEGRPNVASLPSSKTFTALPEKFVSSEHNINYAGRTHLAILPLKNGTTTAEAGWARCMMRT